MIYNKLIFKENWLSYIGAFTFSIIMVVFAFVFSDKEIILPEIVAMAFALLLFKEKSWMKQPEKIFLFPTMTAIAGFFINLLDCPYALKLFLVLIFMLSLMYFCNFSLPPALATGFLPIVTNAHEISFIISISICTFLLAVIVFSLKLNKGTERRGLVDKTKMIQYLGILTSWILISSFWGFEHWAIIPPVAVVIYESIHMKMYNLRIAYKQSMVLFLSAAIGVANYLLFDNWMVVAGCDLILMTGLLSIFKMKIPAVYAFPFLAFILPEEVLIKLPFLSLAFCLFSFGLILVVKKYTVQIETS